MQTYEKEIIIKMIGTTISAFIVATSTFFYFNTDYYKIFSALGVGFGLVIFACVMEYEINDTK